MTVSWLRTVTGRKRGTARFGLVPALVLSMIVTAACGAAAATAPPDARTDPPSTYVVPGTNPTAIFGVAVEERTGALYSSRADGEVLRGQVGTPELTSFLPAGADGRTEAYGMKIDDRGRLYVAGGTTGLVFVHDTRTGALLATFDSGRRDGFVNEVALAPNGDAYLTDSYLPAVYRIPRAAVDRPAAGVAPLERWLDATGSIPYDATAGFGFNLIGAAVSRDGRHLLTVTFNTGRLYRVDLRTREVVQVDLGGEPVFGDGILLDGTTLYAVDAQADRIDTVVLDRDLAAGTVVSRTGRPEFRSPTKIAAWRGDLLVNNSQFKTAFATGSPPEFPYTLSRFPAPPAPARGRLPAVYEVPGERAFPEGVAVDRGRVFASSFSDGTIFRGNVRDDRLTPFIAAGTAGMTQANGITVHRGRLIVAGGVTGAVFVFDARTGEPLTRFDLSGGTPTGRGPADFATAALFVNDVAVAGDGDLYVTDSIRPQLFRIPAAALDERSATPVPVAPWRDLTGTPAAHTDRFNLNGIAAGRDGRHLLTVNSTSGRLFRITAATGEVVEVDLGGARVFGDGLVLDGTTLYSVTGFATSAVDTVVLSEDLARGRLVSTTTAPDLDQPATAALDGRDLLLTNFQIASDLAGEPVDLPFTLARIPAPGPAPR